MFPKLGDPLMLAKRHGWGSLKVPWVTSADCGLRMTLGGSLANLLIFLP